MFFHTSGFMKKMISGVVALPSLLFGTVFAVPLCYEEQDAQYEMLFNDDSQYTYDTDQVDISGGSISLKEKSGVFTKQSGIGGLVDEIDSAANAAWGDYDNDGDQDLFLPTDSLKKNLLYTNNGDGTFTKVTTGVVASELTSSLYADWGDYDNDGDLDLIVSDFPGPPILYRNDGGTFQRVVLPTLLGVASSGPVKWADFNGDGDLDLYVRGLVNKIFIGDGHGNLGLSLTIDDLTLAGNIAHIINVAIADFDGDNDMDILTVGVNGLLGSENRLYENNGNARFDFVSGAGTIVSDSEPSMNAVWFDADGDSDLDLYVANFGTSNSLYLNNGNQTFTKQSSSGAEGGTEQSTGVDAADYDKDGDIDLFVTHYGASGTEDNLYTNNGNATFTISSDADFLSGEVEQSLATTFVDYDGDGYEDIFVVAEGNNMLYRNNAGDIYPNALEINALVPNQAFTLEDLKRMTAITPTYGAGNQGSIELQISMDGGTTYLYWDGAHWETVTDDQDRNTVAVVNANIGTLPVSGDDINVKIFLISDGTDEVDLEKITFDYKKEVEVDCEDDGGNEGGNGDDEDNGRGTDSGELFSGDYQAEHIGDAGDTTGSRPARIRTYTNTNGHEAFAGYIPGTLDLRGHPKHQPKRRVALRRLDNQKAGDSLEVREDAVKEIVEEKNKNETRREYTVLKETFNDTSISREAQYLVVRETLLTPEGQNRVIVRERLNKLGNKDSQDIESFFASAPKNSKRGDLAPRKYSQAELRYNSREKIAQIRKERAKFQPVRVNVPESTSKTKIKRKMETVRFRYGGKSFDMSVLGK